MCVIKNLLNKAEKRFVSVGSFDRRWMSQSCLFGLL